MRTTEVPIFPLRTVLFPDGHLPLRIFEQRYLAMVRECARTDSAFGVCLIVEGAEAGGPVRTTSTGTLARIIDWYTLEDGLLGVSATGGARFRLQGSHRRADGLMLGHIELLPEPASLQLPPAYALLGQVAERFMDKVGDQYPSFAPDRLQDSAWVSYRLAELLPLAAIEKQHLLELPDPLERLQELVELLPRFQAD